MCISLNQKVQHDTQTHKHTSHRLTCPPPHVSGNRWQTWPPISCPVRVLKAMSRRRGPFATRFREGGYLKQESYTCACEQCSNKVQPPTLNSQYPLCLGYDISRGIFFGRLVFLDICPKKEKVGSPAVWNITELTMMKRQVFILDLKHFSLKIRLKTY